jgi:hypothetical protein
MALTDGQHRDLPAYAVGDVKAALLDAGASGTIYAFVMPETEDALEYVIDGCDRDGFLAAANDAAAFRERLHEERRTAYLAMYHEAWTQKQDALHQEYFDTWLDWAAPIVRLDAAAFPHRYPTAGASEGIYKLMAEYAAVRRAVGGEPLIQVFEGEYEGFSAYAEALRLRVVRHDRAGWREVPDAVEPHSLFWISQPSAIDGAVWPEFAAFLALMAEGCPDTFIIPDLTYVGSVARGFSIDLHAPNVAAVVISHSKPFGGYYQRVGGVLSRTESPSLFGNKWFKNLQSLAWATEMMKRHGVFDLPRKYRQIQERAAARVGAALGIAGIAPADVMLLATAPVIGNDTPLLRSVWRGSPSERVVRLCLTPALASLVDPDMAPSTAPRLARLWRALDGERSDERHEA